jgi:predicted RNA-binding protein with TRAM domain
MMKEGGVILKKLFVLLSCFLILALALVGCGKTKVDFTTKQFETALNKGENVEGKTVSVKVNKIVPNSVFGYNIEAGKHLNFVSNDNPDVKKGETVILKVKQVKSTLGSYIIYYEKK